MSRKIKWGVIGSGGIAQRRTIPEGIVPSDIATLTAVYDINYEVNVSVAEKYGALACKSVQELLETDIDAVYIASPVSAHLEHVVACAKANKHILCEKALGLSVKEVEEMISICRNQGVLFGTAFMMRFLAQHKAALKLVQDGSIGKPVYARAQLSCWYPPIDGAWRQDIKTGGGGSLMDMGSHCIDLLEMFLGKIKSVSCVIHNNVHDYNSEDSAIVMMQFENGAMATVDTYFCIPDNSSKNILELYGSKGSILAKGTIGQGDSGEMIAYLEGNAVEYDAQQKRSNDNGVVINPTPVNTYRAEIEEFCRAIIEKREPENSSLIGLQNQIIITACYESAKTGRSIEIEPF
jgi:predicted dehydrogenase